MNEQTKQDEFKEVKEELHRLKIKTRLLEDKINELKRVINLITDQEYIPKSGLT